METGLIRDLLCWIGRHKWSKDSMETIVHTREADTKSIFMAMEYGRSDYYLYKCECCSKEQWYSHVQGAGIGLDRDYRKKLNIRTPKQSNNG